MDEAVTVEWVATVVLAETAEAADPAAMEELPICSTMHRVEETVAPVATAGMAEMAEMVGQVRTAVTAESL
ncbi:hypothetical protein [Bradyrhizobium yuanmingense]|uniref:hypothetical protein n=1 Tax=Bradyrhizobium yuanmingense TaxID=108015 RepID=UPI003510DF1C